MRTDEHPNERGSDSRLNLYLIRTGPELQTPRARSDGNSWPERWPDPRLASPFLESGERSPWARCLTAMPIGCSEGQVAAPRR